jgi:hypothetical protein
MVDGHTWPDRGRRVVDCLVFPCRVYIDLNHCDS